MRRAIDQEPSLWSVIYLTMGAHTQKDLSNHETRFEEIMQ